MKILFLALWLQMSAPPGMMADMATAIIGECRGRCPLDDIVLAEVPEENEWGSEGISDVVPGELMLIHPFAEAAQRAADETDGKPPSGASMLPVAWPEPVDVPAVQVKQLIVKQGDVASDPLCRLFARNTDQNCRAVSDIYHSRYTCADKSRILEHDENSPAKYWCRKVEF